MVKAEKFKAVVEASGFWERGRGQAGAQKGRGATFKEVCLEEWTPNIPG